MSITTTPIKDGVRLSWLCPRCGVKVVRRVTKNQQIVITLKNARTRTDGPGLPVTPLAHRIKEITGLARRNPLCGFWRRKFKEVVGCQK